MGFRADPHPPPKAGDISAPTLSLISSYFIQKCFPDSEPPKKRQELSESLVVSPNPHGACLQQNPERIQGANSDKLNPESFP